MRLFVALELPETVRSSLGELTQELKQTQADVRWVRPEGMHLTLKFIGHVPPEKLSAIRAALQTVSSSSHVQAKFRRLGYFPNERRPRVLWVGVEGSANLAEVALAAENCLVPLGIPAEKRAFRPHLTLGRFKSNKHLARLQEKVAELSAAEFGEMDTGSFFLFESKLSPQGAQYTKLAEFPFVRS